MSTAEERLHQLLLRIYEAGADSERWTALLAQVAEYLGGTACALTVHNFGQREGAIYKASGYDAAYVRSYIDRYASLNIWLEREGPYRRPGTVNTDRSSKRAPAAVPLDALTSPAGCDGSRQFARKTRLGSRLSHVAGVVVLALGSACASPEPAAVPRADGPYIAARPEAFAGRVIGAGYCVDFVKAAAGVPRTTAWREGAAVRGNPHIARGTAIATFETDGSYTSESGNHAAIYVHQDDRGIWVYDQWQGQAVHKRLIRFEGGSGGKWGSKSNDGRRFAVIE